MTGMFTLGYNGFESPGPLTQEKTVVLARGEGVLDISRRLSEQGVVDNPWLFAGFAYFSEKAKSVKAGEYAFQPGISAREVLEKLTEGDVVVHKVVVPEGYTVRDVVEMLKKEKDLTGDIKGDIPEGSLLPETYHFLLGDTRMSVIERMQRNMKDVLNTAWEKRAPGLPISTPEEALTLASIIEKETGVEAERGLVAAVYINRLRMGMRLQADPTVQYGYEKIHGKLTRPLGGEQLRTPTPYNTYLNTGLPPGPIANPGRASIEAALNPPQSDHIFFVATGRGGHRFAATLKEHNANVAAYREAREARASAEE